MKTVVTDYSFDSLDIEKRILEPLGHEVIGAQCHTPEATRDATRNADAVISQYAPLNAEVIAALEKARVIVRYGIGFDNVDIAAARAKGIPVCNVPDYCINEVADHALALLLCATRCIALDNANVHAGKWHSAVPLAAMKTLAQMRIGVVGFGRIGRAVAARLQAFGAEILVFDPVVAPGEIEDAGARAATLDEIWKCDVVTLHCPSNDKTRGLINRENLAKFQRGAILVNVSRGDLVQSAALAEAVASGQLGAAALDVCDAEPPALDNPLLKLDNVLITPHVAAMSTRAIGTLRAAVANTVACALRGEAIPNIINGP